MMRKPCSPLCIYLRKYSKSVTSKSTIMLAVLVVIVLLINVFGVMTGKGGGCLKD